MSKEEFENNKRFISFPDLGSMSPVIELSEILTIEPYKKRIDYQKYTYHLAITMKNGKEVFLKYNSVDSLDSCPTLAALKQL